MATPQYGTIVCALGSPNGPRKSYRIYCSDAAGAITFPSGESYPVLSGDHDVYIVDWFTPTALATMVTVTFYVGGMPEGTVLSTASNIATTILRTLQQSPVKVPKGRTLAMVQA